MIKLQTLGRVRLLGESPGADVASPAAQPKRLALLTYLAVMSGRGPVRRDLLLALFWPELGDEEARRALRQALHYLRRVLGDDVLIGAGEELSLNDERFRCDAVEVERLIAAGEPGRALSLYQGDFLAGFHVSDVAGELEEWVERTRARLRRLAASAAWSAANVAEAAGQNDSAIELGRRACDLDADQESGWRRLMLLQDRIGDRAAALRTYDELAARLEREFEAAPASETTALAGRLRAQRPPSEVSGWHTGRSAAPQPAVLAPAIAEPGTGRRPRWITAAALTALAVGAAVMSARVGAERREERSLIAAGAIAPRDRLLIADFADTGGDTALAIAITEALRVDLTQSPNVRVMTPRQVRGALERMERSADLAVDDSVARELAVREGVKAFVVGRISRLAGGYSLGVEVVGAESGEALAAVRETSTDSSGLIEAVDRASRGLRHRLGESLGDLDALPPLAQVVTASLPALRRFTEGLRLQYENQRDRAIPLFREAVALDSGFASAYLSLAQVYDANAEPGRATESFRSALAYLERLPYGDRQFLLGARAHHREDWDAAVDAYTQYLERYPDNVPALNNLALAYRESRRLGPAETLFSRAVSLDSAIATLYYGLHSVHLLAGRFGDSRRVLDQIGRRFPGNPLLLTVEVQDAAAQQDWEGAERRAEANIAARQADTLGLVDAFEQMAGIVMTQGRLTEAERHWHTQRMLSGASESWGRRLMGALQLGYLQLRYRDDPEAAVAVVDSALASRPLDRTLAGDRPYYELARFFAEAGDVPRARRLVAEAMVNDSLLDRPRRPERAWTAGVIALAERRPGEAEAELRTATDTHVCALCPLPDLARTYEAQGNTAAAIDTYERYLVTPWLFRYEVDASQLGLVLKRLGELYDARGDDLKAAKVRTRLLALWRRADAELQPTLIDIRTRLASPYQ